MRMCAHGCDSERVYMYKKGVVYMQRKRVPHAFIYVGMCMHSYVLMHTFATVIPRILTYIDVHSYKHTCFAHIYLPFCACIHTTLHKTEQSVTLGSKAYHTNIKSICLQST